MKGINDVNTKHNHQHVIPMQQYLISTAADLFNSDCFKTSMAMFKQAGGACRAANDPAGVATCILFQSHVVRTVGDLDVALSLLQQAADLFTKLGDRKGLKNALKHQARVEQIRNCRDAVLAMVKPQQCRHEEQPRR